MQERDLFTPSREGASHALLIANTVIAAHFILSQMTRNCDKKGAAYASGSMRVDDRRPELAKHHSH
jgi:hypothetical protein